ncbi:septum formation protein [Lebetimonas natsushimae]|uniref:Nucleoside triphosphate pyrophosphatase n=1 Tax=Lebetimonas natsushimae TaxID=1936991 RepID=A0A292YHI7_9BACT|nr:septum formation inhibitor Maf [Lebetimonas natsushimae]GAX88329.1 septum formation protein [Lebetimonas natsushimae]
MIILCSSSSTRAELLKKTGIEFIQKSCDFDEEKLNFTDPYEFVINASWGKFKECVKCFNDEIITADTVVTDGKNILRKAKSREDAKKLLLAQSGKEIKIITSMWVKINGKVYGRCDETIYEFFEFDESDLEKYLDSNEWQGKAGACMVEGFCKKYIKNVKGYESTAMGLCIEELINILKEEKCI